MSDDVGHMNISDGGPAFPRPASKGPNYVTGELDDSIDPQEGMSLREWLAGQAIQGMCAGWLELGESAHWPPEQMAREACAVADAVIKELRRRKP